MMDQDPQIVAGLLEDTLQARMESSHLIPLAEQEVMLHEAHEEIHSILEDDGLDNAHKLKALQQLYHDFIDGLPDVEIVDREDDSSTSEGEFASPGDS